MVTAKHLRMCAASLCLLLTSANAQDQAHLARACESELERAEKTVAEARKRPEYRTEKGRHSLAMADRYVNQARNHAAKGESRNCASAAKKGRAQLSAR
jgi:hypothetical protein